VRSFKEEKRKKGVLSFHRGKKKNAAPYAPKRKKNGVHFAKKGRERKHFPLLGGKGQFYAAK